jgi:predicted regulator of Ras-like GTPase activity (Roadblock/LC7/MglB family)
LTALAASDREVTMQTVLSHLSSLSGVVGSLVCDLDGQLAAQAFPAVFDVSTLQDMSRTLANGATALDLSSETTDLLDFRFKDGRLLAKPFGRSMLVVFCTKGANVQFLILSITAAVAKLEKLWQASAPDSPAPPADTAPAALAARAPSGAKKVAAPTGGLDELRRRLGGAAATPRPEGAGVAAVQPPARREPQAKQDKPRTPTTTGLQWWEGMS